MKKIFLNVLITISLVGCSTINTVLDTTLDVLDVLYPSYEMKIICDKDSIGMKYQDYTCYKFNDGTYRWAQKKGISVK